MAVRWRLNCLRKSSAPVVTVHRATAACLESCDEDPIPNLAQVFDETLRVRLSETAACHVNREFCESTSTRLSSWMQNRIKSGR